MPLTPRKELPEVLDKSNVGRVAIKRDAGSPALRAADRHCPLNWSVGMSQRPHCVIETVRCGYANKDAMAGPQNTNDV